MHTHRFPRSPASTYLFLGLVCLGMLVTSLNSACTRSQRVETIQTSLLAVTSARDGFTTWDRVHQQTIVDAATSKEQGLALLADYREKRRPWIERFEVAFRALAVAATQTDEVSLSAAVALATELVQAIEDLIKGSK